MCVIFFSYGTFIFWKIQYLCLHRDPERTISVRLLHADHSPAPLACKQLFHAKGKDQDNTTASSSQNFSAADDACELLFVGVVGTESKSFYRWLLLSNDIRSLKKEEHDIGTSHCFSLVISFNWLSLFTYFKKKCALLISIYFM